MGVVLMLVLLDLGEFMEMGQEEVLVEEGEGGVQVEG